MEISEKYIKIIKEVTKIMLPFPVYVTGGFVRDTLIGIEPHDIDFSTPANPEEIETKIKNSLNEHGDKRKVVTVGKQFGCLKCKVFGEEVDIVSFRTEHYLPNNRKPEVKFVKTIEQDLGRRDFTINSIGLRLTKSNRIKLIDPYNGQNDLKNGIIKCVGNARTRFKEDPLRMLRAIRFSCRFNYEIEEITMKRIISGAIQILNISKERWMSELDKILQSENVERGLMDLWQSNLFKFMIPELELMSGYDQNSQYHSWNLDVHTINVVQAVRNETDDLNMLWAGLLHDIAKPFVRTDKTISEKDAAKIKFDVKTKSNYIGHEVLGAEMVDRIATHLKWSNDRRKKVVELVRNHLNEDSPLRKYDNEGKK